MIEYNKSDEGRKRNSEFMKQLYKDDNYKSNITKGIIKYSKSDEGRKQRSKRMKELWNNDIYINNLTYKYKEYIMPSGKIVKVQGYENKALDILIQKYTEDDIIVELKEINKIFKFRYLLNNKEHRYFPDFYIKSTNTIIEVKCEWTYNIDKEKNELKKQCCLDNGFNFVFMIL
jgi:RNA recognition motif-containing protein